MSSEQGQGNNKQMFVVNKYQFHNHILIPLQKQKPKNPIKFYSKKSNFLNSLSLNISGTSVILLPGVGCNLVRFLDNSNDKSANSTSLN